MPGYPRPSCLNEARTWMPGTRPGMTSSARSHRTDLRRQRHGPSVVAIDPVGISLSAQPRIGARGLLDAGSPRLARCLEAAKRIRNSIRLDTVETTRQHGGIL